MGLALLKGNELNGTCRKDFEDALLQIGDIARIAEQKLTLKVDNWIKESYKEHILEFDQVELKINSLLK